MHCLQFEMNRRREELSFDDREKSFQPKLQEAVEDFLEGCLRFWIFD